MPLSKRPHHLPSSPIKVDQATITQGIVAILRSDCDQRSKAPSIRRTLSADMSSKKWLEQNGLLSPLKKIASTQEMAMSPDSSSSSEGEEEYEKRRPGQDDVWRSIQLQKERSEVQTPKTDVWGSLILTQKSENGISSSTLPPPYIHPLVRRSSSILSEKSLEICTESLGSETGSDVFSSYSPSIDADEEKEERFVQGELKEANPFEDLHVPKYKTSPVRPFPPPIPSIAGGDGQGLLMHSHRENGRLVLEAVSVPPRNNFHAQRCDGRLVLTLIGAPDSLENEQVDENKVDEFEEVFDKMEEFDEKIEENVVDGDGYSEEEQEVEELENKIEAKPVEFVMEQINIRSLPSKMISVHKSGLVMKKLTNKNPTWSNKFNKGEEELPIPQSLPPPPRVARLIPPPPPPQPATASFNAYEYFWRNNNPVSTGGFINPVITTLRSTNNYYNNNKMNGPYEHQDLVVRRGNKSENYVPYFKGCKEGRRSLSIWEPYCIATS